MSALLPSQAVNNLVEAIVPEKTKNKCSFLKRGQGLQRLKFISKSKAKPNSKNETTGATKVTGAISGAARPIQNEGFSAAAETLVSSSEFRSYSAVSKSDFTEPCINLATLKVFSDKNKHIYNNDDEQSELELLREKYEQLNNEYSKALRELGESRNYIDSQRTQQVKFHKLSFI